MVLKVVLVLFSGCYAGPRDVLCDPVAHICTTMHATGGNRLEAYSCQLISYSLGTMVCRGSSGFCKYVPTFWHKGVQGQTVGFADMSHFVAQRCAGANSGFSQICTHFVAQWCAGVNSWFCRYVLTLWYNGMQGQTVSFANMYVLTLWHNGMQGQTALHWAARRGYATVVAELLCHGADVHALDSQVSHSPTNPRCSLHYIYLGFRV